MSERLIVTFNKFLKELEMGWIFFGILLVWYIVSMYRSASKRNHLTYFIVYLLLSDKVYEAQKKGFTDWIKNTKAENADQLAILSSDAVERLADQLAAGDPTNPGTSSTIGSTILLWKTKEQLNNL